MNNYRIEKDFLGEVKISNSSYYGINTKRAMDNFSLDGKTVSIDIINAIVLVKKAAAMANIKTGDLDREIGKHIIDACDKILDGSFDDQFPVPKIQGGAGTSTNMNVNEVISNVALESMGFEKGSYNIVHPNNHVNMSQSTNDVYPSAIKICLVGKIRKLAETFAKLQESLQIKEEEFSDIIKLGRTQLMDALPITVGQEFGAFAKAISRDRWRIYKSEERLRQINIGGTAIGTSLNARIKYIFYVTENIQNLTGFGMARSEFLVDTTQNADVFTEVSGFLKSASVNLIKISNDLRLLASGPYGGFGELKLEKLQQGSSIMPGKVNPVMPEFILQVANKVISNDLLITNLAASGQLELNPFLPMIAETLIESLDLLYKSVGLFIEKCIDTISVDVERCNENLEKSKVLAAALIHHIGYENASKVYNIAIEKNISVKQATMELGFLKEDEIDQILDEKQVTKAGIPGGNK